MLWAGGVSRKIRDVIDGTSNTLFVGESHSHQGSPDGVGCHYVSHWTASWIFSGTPYGINLTTTGFLADCGFRSRHPGGAQFVMVDGSARFVSETVNMVLFSGLGTAHGGEVVGEF